MSSTKFLPAAGLIAIWTICASAVPAADRSYNNDSPSPPSQLSDGDDDGPALENSTPQNAKDRSTSERANPSVGDKIAPPETWSKRNPQSRNSQNTNSRTAASSKSGQSPAWQNQDGAVESGAALGAEPQMLPQNASGARMRPADGAAQSGTYNSGPYYQNRSNPRTAMRGTGARPAAYNPGDPNATSVIAPKAAMSGPGPGNVPPPGYQPSGRSAPNSMPNSAQNYSDNQNESWGDYNDRGATSLNPNALWSGGPGNPDWHMNYEGSSPDCGGSCNSCGWNPCGCPGWFAAAEYLYVRPNFSEQQAFIRRNTFVDPETEAVTVTDSVVHQDFGYNSSARTYFGYRFPCGDEIRFTYWNYGGDYSNSSGRSNADGSVIFAGHLELVTQVPGQRIISEGSLNANVYDLDYAKCTCGTSCCDPCRCCPPWTLKYFAGIRLADIRRQDNNFLLNRDDEGDRAAFISADFIGAGPRVGLEGRRFFQHGCTSLYAKGDFALLLGQYDIKETRKTPPSNPSATENLFDSHDRMIPVAEIEFGGSLQLNRHVNLSAGYLFQAWWDLGAFEQIEGNVFLNPIDDANIMSFDGLVARIEITF